MNGELQGLNILLTRQAHTMDNISQKISALGGNAVQFPMFAIEPSLSVADLELMRTKLINCDLAICISRNSAQIISPYIKDLAYINWAAVGPGTAAFLKTVGATNVISPNKEPYDSASLMQTLKLHNINLKNQYIMVLTGENGDGYLAKALAQEGARVEVVALYRRIMPAISSTQLQKLFNAKPGINTILITCVTSLVNLVQLAKAAKIEICKTPLLVVSPRIYKYAIAQGFSAVYSALGMSDEAILSALIERFKQNA